jgi:hypothetical protein
MVIEKMLFLPSGRAVKVITHVADAKKVPFHTAIEVLIKEPKEDHFHPPIGTSHPKYWKLKGMDPEKSRFMQISYSGLSKKQLRKVLNDLAATLT